MRSHSLRRLSVFLGCLALALPALAGKYRASDFPLRVHIVARNGIRHYHGYGGGFSSLTEVDGMGEANLFENGQPLGFDFKYQCGQPLMHQPGFETFMARWKKQGRVLEILEPVIGGKPDEMNSCDLDVTMKQDTVYIRRNGGVSEEPAAVFKAWMVSHQYDPEHGKDEPVNSQSKPAPSGSDAQQ